MATVFVSHASTDGVLADEVCFWLQSEGHVHFWIAIRTMAWRWGSPGRSGSIGSCGRLMR